METWKDFLIRVAGTIALAVTGFCFLLILVPSSFFSPLGVIVLVTTLISGKQNIETYRKGICLGCGRHFPKITKFYSYKKQRGLSWLFLRRKVKVERLICGNCGCELSRKEKEIRHK